MIDLRAFAGSATFRGVASGRDGYATARLVHAVLRAATWVGRPARSVRARTADRLLRLLAARLARSAVTEHRTIATPLADAIEEGDYRTALSIASTAMRRPDLRAEKIISRRYRYLWVCNPKAASRSIIAALRAADSDARLIEGRTVGELLAEHPEARDYWSFAFVRHPCTRAYSFYADKHGLARSSIDDYRWFVEPYYGVRAGMRFDEVCRWLNTPFGSDAFADRHWLSQHRHIRVAGRLPDFVGAFERLEADWRRVTEYLGLPFRKPPRLNVRSDRAAAEADLITANVALLERRYTEDFQLGDYPRPIARQRTSFPKMPLRITGSR